MLSRDPGPGISVWAAKEDSTAELCGLIVGPEESPYEKGLFELTISIPPRFLPPFAA
jgi:ubiquitin-protein ligase